MKTSPSLLLAPIPYIHLESVLQDIKEKKLPSNHTFAFGTSSLPAVAQFRVLQEEFGGNLNLPTAIFVTPVGFERDNLTSHNILRGAGQYLMEAKLVGYVDADKRGRLPRGYEASRPTTTFDDSSFTGFYLLSDLSQPTNPKTIFDKFQMDELKEFKPVEWPRFV